MDSLSNNMNDNNNNFITIKKKSKTNIKEFTVNEQKITCCKTWWNYNLANKYEKIVL